MIAFNCPTFIQTWCFKSKGHAAAAAAAAVVAAAAAAAAVVAARQRGRRERPVASVGSLSSQRVGERGGRRGVWEEI